MGRFSFVVCAALAVGCASAVPAQPARSSNQILKKEEPAVESYVVRSGNFVRKWEQSESGAAGVLYEVDTVKRVCRSKQQVIDCEKLRGDADMAQFITWSKG